LRRSKLLRGSRQRSAQHYERKMKSHEHLLESVERNSEVYHNQSPTLAILLASHPSLRYT